MLNKVALKVLVINGLPNNFPDSVIFMDDWMLSHTFNTKDENGGEWFNSFTVSYCFP